MRSRKGVSSLWLVDSFHPSVPAVTLGEQTCLYLCVDEGGSGTAVREIKRCPVWLKELAECSLQVHWYNVCPCLPGQGVFSTAASILSVLSCFYFRKLLLVRSPAKLCMGPSA